VPPEQRFVPRFVAEPPQEGLPYGRFEQRLRAELLGACLALEAGEGEELGEPGEIVWYPERSWHGHTYVPASTITSRGQEIYGYVRYRPAHAREADEEVDGEAIEEGSNAGEREMGPAEPDSGERPELEPGELYAWVDFTEETAERNPDWTLDLCEETIGSWRGHAGAVAAIALVWGRALLGGGRVATAELGGLTVDQCELAQERFTLIAPDDYRGDLLEIALFGWRGQELARESLYAEEEEEEEEEAT
jgi:hypothetical protein